MTESLESLFLAVDTRLSAMLGQRKELVFGVDETAQLSLRQIYYIHAIHQLGRPTISDMAEFFKVSKPSATITIQTLVSSGYLVKQQSHADKRVFHLSLSEKGQRVVAIKDETFHQFAAQIRAGMAPQEVAELSRLLEKALENSHV